MTQFAPPSATLPEVPAGDPVSLVVRRRIRRGAEAQYEARLSEASAQLARLPGHIGTGILRPPPGEAGVYTMIARFDSFASAAAWELSPERALWLSHIAPLVDEHVSFEKQPGLEFWFTPAAAPTLRQPPRWKMTLLTIGVLYPVSLSVTLLLAPHLLAWPLPLRALAQSLVIVPAMTYAFMPLATRGAAGWLRGK